MEIEYGVTAEQANAALRILRDAGINTEQMAEILQKAIEVITRAFEMLSGTFKTIADAWENIKESGVLDVETNPRARQRKQERARARMIEERYRAEIRQVEKTKIYRRIYKPP